MALCYRCRQQCPDLAEEDGRPLWHYRTIERRCDNCGAEFSHERVHTHVEGEVR